MLSWLWRILFNRKARPGEIWWADVPFEDGPGSKVRPCLIVRVTFTGYDVLKITSQDQSRRRDHIQIETRAWDRNADKNSYLDLTDPIRIRTVDNKAGALDRPTWTKVRKLHSV
ncbi:type II toxin-antitoxin system PemK/MazF family toxin [Catelliglobosispora koreensis]|uniref:type II toxin-antitoxin system PemK/MazF family toxin n=1 Tax=Catelliglobosispora koreensis TaxID=129052 RepID=UPI00038011CF|nr:type II toxin-antitoxin system PemK/MazF family toxin [Catelliglobosispora koreensis]